MPRSASFYLSNWPGAHAVNVIGRNHAGLECDRGTGQPYYVTWNGTAKGADWGNSQHRMSKLPARNR